MWCIENKSRNIITIMCKTHIVSNFSFSLSITKKSKITGGHYNIVNDKNSYKKNKSVVEINTERNYYYR